MADNNIIFIGMPAVGKSTVGVVIAKRLGYKFVDTDILIQESEGKLLKDIIECQDKYLKILKDYGYQNQPVYKFRVMKSKWGVCYTRKNTVTINPMLIHFDKRYLEGVLWHELLHFIIPNHSKRFHEVLEYHMKDYKELMKGLK